MHHYYFVYLYSYETSPCTIFIINKRAGDPCVLPVHSRELSSGVWWAGVDVGDIADLPLNTGWLSAVTTALPNTRLPPWAMILAIRDNLQSQEGDLDLVGCLWHTANVDFTHSRFGPYIYHPAPVHKTPCQFTSFSQGDYHSCDGGRKKAKWPNNPMQVKYKENMSHASHKLALQPFVPHLNKPYNKQ